MKKLLPVIAAFVLIFNHVFIIHVSTLEVWDGNVSEVFASGSGSSGDPFIIETAGQLAYLANIVNGGNTCAGKYFRLEKDIALNDISSISAWRTIAPSNVWTPIGLAPMSFAGTFDGNGHVISGMYIKSLDTSGRGLFASLSGSVLALGVTDSFISASNGFAGGIAAESSGSISECYFRGSISANNNSGGIVGKLSPSGIVKNCYSVSYMDGVLKAGGIVGDNQGTVTKCYAAGKVTCTGVCGPITGWNNGNVISSYYNTSWYSETWTPDYKSSNPSNIIKINNNAPPSFTLNGTPLTENNMKLAASFTGFDFEGIWCMEGEIDYYYPELKATQPIKGDVNLDSEANALDLIEIKNAIINQTGFSGRKSAAIQFASGWDLEYACGQLMLIIVNDGKIG